MGYFTKNTYKMPSIKEAANSVNNPAAEDSSVNNSSSEDVQTTEVIPTRNSQPESQSTFDLERMANMLEKKTTQKTKKMNPKVTGIIIPLIVAVLCGYGIYSDVFANSDITPSTVERTKNVGEVNATEKKYYIDGNWTSSTASLSINLDTFYKDTGVMPYLYIAEEDSCKSQEDAEKLAGEIYDDVVTDEGHFLYLFAPSGDTYFESFFIGSDATTVMDGEAIQIFSDYVAKYTEKYSNSRTEIFPKVYASSDKRIMNVTGWNANHTVYAMIGGAALIFLLYQVYNQSKKPASEEESEDKKENNA